LTPPAVSRFNSRCSLDITRWNGVPEVRIGWVGVHAEGISALKAVCGAEYNVAGLMTLRQDKADKRCGSADYELICLQYDIPYHEVGNVNDFGSIAVLQSWQCDLLVVLGWGQILGPDALKQATIGAVGAHASLLPHNRGSAPVNWAIIRGEHQTGNSLIWLEEGVDAGHLIDQMSFPITSYDSCTTVYDKVADSNREMLLSLLHQLKAGERPGQPQQEPHDAVLPRRRPQDGVIHWNSSSEEIYNLVRALTRPYPGAFAFLNNQPYRIWSAARTPMTVSIAEAGTVMGPVHSPEPKACGQMVATADGAILILEVEDASGNVLQGPELSEQDWTGRRLSNAA
jgi:methionyl-tRNA formyltransferase